MMQLMNGRRKFYHIMVAALFIFCEFKAEMQQRNMQQYALCGA